MQELRSGSEAAAWQIVEQFGPYILRVVRRDLRNDLRREVDSADLVQAVWASFFLRSVMRREFDSPEHLVGYLAGVAKNKVMLEARFRIGTQRRDMRRTVSLSWAAARVSHNSDPHEIAVAREKWEQSVSGQSDTITSMVSMRLQGHTYKSIATELKCNERTVRRNVQRLLEVLTA
jgi:RNA polymerase sigma factor (sigma-70 family)